MRKVILTLLLLAAPAGADPPRLQIPAEVSAHGDYATIVPDTDAVSVVYIGLSNVQPFPSAFLKDSRAFVLPTRGLSAGRYKFVAVGAGKGGEQAQEAFVVLVGDVPPVPPPDPVPVPRDPLWPSMKAAYVADTTTANKTPCALQLASVFKVAGTTTAYDPAIQSMGDLFTTISRASQALVPLPALQTTREVVGKELVAKLGSDATTALTPALRKAASEQFARMSGLYQALAEGQ